MVKTVFKKIDTESFFNSMKTCTPRWNGDNTSLNFYADNRLEGYIAASGQAYWKEEV